MSIIHYYSLCWNEEKILPFVLNYYFPYCDKITIMDNESDDNSVKIIQSYTKTEVRSYSTQGEIRDDIYLEIKNNIWKESRGKADWVIVCDVDEILYHPNLISKLKELKDEGFTIIKPHGYDMYSENFPTKSLLEITTGVKDNRLLGKCIIFNPNKIDEINYKTGCHKCYPTGELKFYKKNDFKMLHYKCLNLDYLIDRFSLLNKRLSNYNIENKFGKHYMAEKETIIRKYLINKSNSRNVFETELKGLSGWAHDRFIRKKRV